MSTKRALLYVYAGYFVRYIYLLILIPFYGRVLGADAYGRVLAAMSLYNVVWIVVNYGFSTVGAREVASSPGLQQVTSEFGRHLSGRLTMSVLGVAIGLVALWLSPLLRAEPAFGLVATALGVLQAYNLGWFFQGLHRFRTSIALEVTGFVISLVLVLSLVHAPGDAIFVLWSLLISTACTTLVAYGIASRTIEPTLLRLKGGVALIKESTSIFFLGGIPTFFINASTYMLSMFAVASEVGHFGAAERLASIVLSLMVPANQVLISTVSQRVASERAPSEGLGLMRTALKVMLSFGVVSTLTVALLAPFAVPLVLGAEFTQAVRVLQLLALMYPLAAFTQVASLYVLIPLRRDVLAMKLTLSGALIHLVAFLVLAHLYGGTGAAVARVVGELATALLLLFALVREGLLKKIVSSATR